MNITSRSIDSILVVDLEGRLDTIHSGQASDELARLTHGTMRRVVLNLGCLEFLSSAGLRVMLRAAKSLRAMGGELKVCSPQGVVAEVLAAAGFSSLLHVCENEDIAVDAFRRDDTEKL